MCVKVGSTLNLESDRAKGDILGRYLLGCPLLGGAPRLRYETVSMPDSEHSVESPEGGSSSSENAVASTKVRVVVSAWLAMAAVLAYLCRNSLVVAESSLRADLGITESQMGFILGPAFFLDVRPGPDSHRLAGRTVWIAPLLANVLHGMVGGRSSDRTCFGLRVGLSEPHRHGNCASRPLSGLRTNDRPLASKNGTSTGKRSSQRRDVRGRRGRRRINRLDARVHVGPVHFCHLCVAGLAVGARVLVVVS